MDTLDTRLKDFFTPAAPARLARRVLRRVDEPGPDLSGLIARFAIEASDRGVRRQGPSPGTAAPRGPPAP